MVKKISVILAVLNFVILFNPSMSIAGTGKILSWCSYLDVNNNNGGNIKRMRCISTMGGASSYCFNFLLFANGLNTGGDCDVWMPMSDISLDNIKYLDTIFGTWNHGPRGTTPEILKNKNDGDIILIHGNETSPELEYCDKRSRGMAGVIEPGDICWLGEAASKLTGPFAE